MLCQPQKACQQHDQITGRSGAHRCSRWCLLQLGVIDAAPGLLCVDAPLPLWGHLHLRDIWQALHRPSLFTHVHARLWRLCSMSCCLAYISFSVFTSTRESSKQVASSQVQVSQRLVKLSVCRQFRMRCTKALVCRSCTQECASLWPHCSLWDAHKILTGAFLKCQAAHLQAVQDALHKGVGVQVLHAGVRQRVGALPFARAVCAVQER